MSIISKIRGLFKRKDFYKEDNRIKDKSRVAFSPSGKYSLDIDLYYTHSGAWEYSRGRVLRGTKQIADVKRNYTSFPYLFVENHPNGHDYLICGFDYQGQTIIELDTGKRIDYLPKEAEDGNGFCWAEYIVSPTKKTLMVCGCVWGGPYEIVLYDFSNPMSLPYKKLGCGDAYIYDLKDIDADPEYMLKWQADGSVILINYEKDGKDWKQIKTVWRE